MSQEVDDTLEDLIGSPDPDQMPDYSSGDEHNETLEGSVNIRSPPPRCSEPDEVLSGTPSCLFNSPPNGPPLEFPGGRLPLSALPIPPAPTAVVPPTALAMFSSPDLCYIRLVDKVDHKGKSQRRVLCLTSTALFLYDPTVDPRASFVKALKRAVDILHISCLYFTVSKRRQSIISRTEVSRTTILLKIDTQYDIVFQVVDEGNPAARASAQLPSVQDEFFQALTCSVEYRKHQLGIHPGVPLKLMSTSDVLSIARLERSAAPVSYRGPMWALQEIACDERHQSSQHLSREELLHVVARLQQRMGEVLVDNHRLKEEVRSMQEELEALHLENQV